MGKLRTWLGLDSRPLSEHSNIGEVFWAIESGQELGNLRNRSASVAAIYRARSLTTDVLASMPLRIGSVPLEPLNPRQTVREFVTETVRSMIDKGDAYLRITQDRNLHVLKPSSMDVTWSQDGETRVYTYRNVRQFPSSLMVLALDRGPEDLTGFGPMQSERIAGLIAEQAYSQTYFENSSNPTGLITSPHRLDKATAEKLQAQWIEQQAQARRPAVLSGGLSWEATAASPQETDWVKTHVAGVGDAGLLFGVPGTILGYNTPGSSLTYESLADVHEQWWREVLYPSYAKPIEDALSEIKAAPVRFDPEEFFLASLGTRAQATRTLVDAGYDPAAAADVAGLPPMAHTGAAPTTVQKEE